jgi:hypothetical protein
VSASCSYRSFWRYLLPTKSESECRLAAGIGHSGEMHCQQREGSYMLQQVTVSAGCSCQLSSKYLLPTKSEVSVSEATVSFIWIFIMIQKRLPEKNIIEA